MKKALCVIHLLFVIFILAACGGGNIENVEVVEWEPSVIYTDRDIELAIQVVKDNFEKEFDGCTLTKIGYIGDSSLIEFKGWADRYNADEAIALYSSFNVGASCRDVSLKTDYTYDDWLWILVRNNGGVWQHVDHGY